MLYCNFTFLDDLPLEDGEQEIEIALKLPQHPLPQEEDRFTLKLDEPKGCNAKLGDITSCDVTVTNSFGEFPSKYVVF